MDKMEKATLLGKTSNSSRNASKISEAECKAKRRQEEWGKGKLKAAGGKFACRGR